MLLLAHRRYFFILSSVFLLIWTALAINPNDRADWALENLLVVVFVAALFATYRRLTFSRVSYTLIFLFIGLHASARTTPMRKCPTTRGSRWLTGRSLNETLGWTRNNYDRFVHFWYGLLLAYPIREIFLRVANVRGFWGYFLPLDLTMSTSMVFELLEWAVVGVFGGRSRQGLSRHPGRRVGRAQGHGAGHPGRPDRHGRTASPSMRAASAISRANGSRASGSSASGRWAKTPLPGGAAAIQPDRSSAAQPLGRTGQPARARSDRTGPDPAGAPQRDCGQRPKPDPHRRSERHFKHGSFRRQSPRLDDPATIASGL